MKKAVLVVGAGDATGGEIAKRFAREGYTACVTRRTAGKLELLVAQIGAAGGEAQGSYRLDARDGNQALDRTLVTRSSVPGRTVQGRVSENRGCA